MNSRTALEQALLDDPHDRGRWQVFADWLLQERDPRGELMLVQLALEDEGRPEEERRTLEARERALIEAHGEALLGALAPRISAQRAFGGPSPTVRFRRGLVHHLGFSSLTFADVEALASWSERPFLRSLEVEGDLDDEGALEALADVDLRGLTRLAHGNPEDRSYTSGRRLHEMVQTMASLEVLESYSEDVDIEALFATPLPRLRTLSVHHRPFFFLERLAQNPSLEALETLDLCAEEGPVEAPSAVSQEGVTLLLSESSALRNLRVLRLRRCGITNDLVHALTRGPGFSNLRELALVDGLISDDGARSLAEAGLERLEHLDLSGNVFSVDGLSRLEATGVTLVVRDQRQIDALFYANF